MKKNFYFLLLAALVCGLSLSVTSCKDDDKDNNGGQSEEQKDQQALEEQDKDNARFALLAQLCDADDIDDNFLAGNFEPTIGVEETEGEPSVRIVSVNSMEAAAARFADLADAEIDENTSEYIWKDEKMGTMTYTKADDGKAWATVAVSIKQVPQLQKIIYRSVDQSDANVSGKFKGRAYYRFGDVVRRKVKDIDEYWVCVRPAFSLEGKGDSHWACVNVLTDKNVYAYSNDNTNFFFPTGLGENKEHMQNLAEMIYAIIDPDGWSRNIINNENNKNMKMFGDFHKENLQYHNANFWSNVSKGWDNKYVPLYPESQNIFGVVFNTTRNGVVRAVRGSEYGLKLLYKGYSWKKKGKVIHLWQANYTSGSGVNCNMHQATFTEPSCDLTKKDDWEIDFRKTGGYLGRYCQFFDPNERDEKFRWCVRFSTGKDLATKRWNGNVKEAIPGVDEIYRYYRDADPESGKDLSKDPEVAKPLYLF